MAKERFESGKAPAIEIANCSGNLVIRVWPEPAIQAKGEFEVNEKNDVWVFTANGDLRLVVPENSSVAVNQTSGDLLIKGVKNDIAVQNVNGDAILTNLNNLKLGDVNGDLVVKNIDGRIGAGNVHGDVVIRNANDDAAFENVFGDISAQFINGHLQIMTVNGDISVKTINGELSINQGLRDVNLKNIGGPVSLPDVLGDIRVKGGLSAGEHILAAKGDIILRWPVGTPLTLMAKASNINNRLRFDEVTETVDSLSGRIGDGETMVSLVAGGRIILKESQIVDPKWESELGDDFDFDFNFDEFNGLGEKISKEVNQHMDRMTSEIEAKFGPDFALRISEKVSQQAERAARRAQQAADKAQRYAEREVARAQKAQRRAGREYAPPPPPPPPPSKPKTKATTEEQLKILKMVEKGTITPDDANTLLKALEQ